MTLADKMLTLTRFHGQRQITYSLSLRLAAFALLVAASGPAMSSQEPFVYAYVGEEQVHTLDYLDAHDARRLAIEAHVMEGLLVFDIANEDNPTTNLAVEYHHIPPNTHVFRLRQDVYFHPHRHKPGGDVKTAEAVEASDVKFSLLRGRYSKTPLAYLLDPIKDIEVIQPDLIKIELSRSDPQFLAALATSIGHITCEEYYNSLGVTDDKRSARFKKHPVGTGPYFLPIPLGPTQQLIVLERFSGYRDQDFVKDPRAAQRIQFLYRKTAAEIAELLVARHVHMTSLQMTDFGNGLGLQPDTGVITQLDTPFLSILAFNLDQSHLKNPELRRLLNEAIEPERILQICPSHSKGLGPGIRNLLDLKGARFSLESEESEPETWTHLQAQELLAPLKKRRALRLLMQKSNDPTRKAIVNEVVSSLREKLGLEIEIETSSRVLDEVLGQTRDFDLVYIEWTPDTPLQQENLSILYPLFSSRSHYNFARYKNKEVDRCFSDILRLGNPSGLQETYRQAQVLLSKDAPFIWLPSVRHRAIYLLAGYSATYQELGDRSSEFASSLMFYTPFLLGVRKGH